MIDGCPRYALLEQVERLVARDDPMAPIFKGSSPAAIPFALAFNPSTPATTPRASASRIAPSAVNLG
jgi:hypothetical protein